MYDYQVYQNWVIFVLTILVLPIVFISLKFKIDPSGIVTLSLYLLISAGRVAANYVEDKSTFEYFTFKVQFVNLMWISVYYFTIQLMLIQLAH